MGRPAALTALVAACALLTGCGDAGRDCTLIGGVSGIEVTVPQALSVPSGSLTLRLCQADRCWSQVERLGPERRPTPRSVTVDFPGLLGPTIVAGDAVVSAELERADGTRTARLPRTPIELEASYPNGRACDGDGNVVGDVSFSATDAVGR